MLNNAEEYLCRAIGAFSTVAQVSFTSNSYGLGYNADNYNFKFLKVIPSQCSAFLTSSYTFLWFIENWNVKRNNGNVTLQDKKVYPAKVTGLNIPYPATQTFQWKEGLIDNSWGTIENYRSYFRPGFGQTQLSDLNRPFLSATVTKNTLGLGDFAVLGNLGFVGPFGRLMSMAFWVDPKDGAEYDASKKKKKSLNSQDYEQMPTYPDYTIYSEGGYGG